MFGLQLAAITLVNLFKSRRRLEAENMLLRHQLSVALRSAPNRPRLRGMDRAILVWMVRRWPDLLGRLCYVDERQTQQTVNSLGSSRCGDLTPRLHGRGSKSSVRAGGDEVALNVEGIVGGCVEGQESLGQSHILWPLIFTTISSKCHRPVGLGLERRRF
jgi:hypothetical protein